MAKNTKQLLEKGLEIGGSIIKCVGEMSIPMLTCGVARAILPPQVNVIVKGGALLGGMLVGSLVTERVGDHIDREMKEMADDFSDTVSEVKRNLDIIRSEKKKEETTE